VKKRGKNSILSIGKRPIVKIKRRGKNIIGKMEGKRESLTAEKRPILEKKTCHHGGPTLVRENQRGKKARDKY